MISSNSPVIIVGAGPCGLVAALTLQKHGIPFVIIEKATRSKICSNAGSGFELAPTALDILGNRLNVPTHKIMLKYGGAHIQTFQDKVLGETQMTMPFCSVNRAELQNLLLEILFPTSDLEDGFLKCGVALDSYEEDTANGKVTVYLKTGEKDESSTTSIVGCALLGCDGIHSKVRKSIHSDQTQDSLHFCNCVAYWAKCPIPNGSDFEKEFNKTQKYRDDGPSFVVALGTRTNPGSLFAIPTNGKLLWGMFFSSEKPPADTNDLTRRGGGILTEKGKQELLKKFEGSDTSTFIKSIVQQTNAADITEAGIFDRENLNLPYSSAGKLVAILGDAAHPQSPFAGQGVNMAIADAYVLASRIALGAKVGQGFVVPNSIAKFDTSDRRDSVKNVIEVSRDFTRWALSSNPITCFLFRLMITVLPLSWILNDAMKYDNSNAELMRKLEEDYPEIKSNSEKV